jgi:hypothetical protein
MQGRRPFKVVGKRKGRPSKTVPRTGKKKTRVKLTIEDHKHSLEMNHTLLTLLNEAMQFGLAKKRDNMVSTLEDALKLHETMVGEHRKHGGKLTPESKNLVRVLKQVLKSAKSKNTNQFEVMRKLDSLIKANDQALASSSKKLNTIQTRKVA